MAIITTAGVLKKEELGITLIHEHLFDDLTFTYRPPEEDIKKRLGDRISLNNLHILKNEPGSIKNNLRLDEPDVALTELGYFKESGGRTLVEQTSIGLGRRETDISLLAEKLGLNIVISTGYYLKNTQTSEVLAASKDALAANMIREIQTGINNTNIKAGIIGELGIFPDIEDWEKKLLAAGAKAQRETGVAMFVHIQAVPTVPGFSGELNGLEALKILEKEGADIEKVVICHTDSKTNTDYIRKIVKSGAYAELDHFSKEFYHRNFDFLMDRDYDRVCAIKELIDDGYIKKLLISQDNCIKTDLITYGGNGYTHILKNIIPMMKNKGFSQQDIDDLLIYNPAKILDIDERYL